MLTHVMCANKDAGVFLSVNLVVDISQCLGGACIFKGSIESCGVPQTGLSQRNKERPWLLGADAD